MKTIKLTFAAALASFATAAASDVFVIAHTSVQISGAEVRDIFLGDKQFAGSVKLIPVDNGPAQEQFLAKALKTDSTKYNSAWTKKSFREGLNPPAVKSGDAEVVDFVRKTPGAVGYVGSSPAGVTIIQKY